MPDDQEPVLNKEAALELCYDNEDLFLKIVQAYLEGAMKHSKHLLYAHEAGDATTGGRAGTCLKSGFFQHLCRSVSGSGTIIGTGRA